jgi:hypothetical protein
MVRDNALEDAAFEYSVKLSVVSIKVIFADRRVLRFRFAVCDVIGIEPRV